MLPSKFIDVINLIKSRYKKRHSTIGKTEIKKAYRKALKHFSETYAPIKLIASNR